MAIVGQRRPAGAEECPAVVLAPTILKMTEMPMKMTSQQVGAMGTALRERIEPQVMSLTYEVQDDWNSSSCQPS